MSIFSLLIALSISLKVIFNLLRSFSLTLISISSIGYPDILVFEIPSSALRSSSISSATSLSWRKLTAPFMAKDIAGFKFSIINIEGDSIWFGNELILSIAFLISWSTNWLLASLLISIVTLLVFSDDLDVTRFIPVIPSRLSSILRVTICSISNGDAPGYTAWTVINFDVLSGKKVLRKLDKPIVPKTIISNIITFDAIGYFIKYFIRSLIIYFCILIFIPV